MTERKTCKPATPRGQHRRNMRAGFTLIEMMVALSIFMLMMAIIFVPLNMGVNFFHMGRARSEVQQAAHLTMIKIENDLSQATLVYPNDVTPGITDQAPYTNFDPAGHPYYQAKASDTVDQTVNSSGTSRGIACASPDARSNTARIDFQRPATDGNGQKIVVNGTPLTYLVTYYARRLSTYDTTGAPLTYDPVDNPLVLFRAQMPIQDDSGVKNDTSATRYTPTACPAANDPLLWLSQSKYGEPNLESLSNKDTTYLTHPLVGLHDQVTPRGMGLISPHAQDDQNPLMATPQPPSYTPETSFICSTTTNSNGDTLVNHVRVTLVMGQFDGAGYQPAAQTVRISQDIDLSPPSGSIASQ